jgi:hypothetical protein
MERTLGWCNVATDDIACGPNYNFQFSANPTRTFTNPGGVSKQETSILTGLAGTGVNDYIIDGQAPQQAGLPPVVTPPPTNNPPKGNSPGNNPPITNPGKPGKNNP